MSVSSAIPPVVHLASIGIPDTMLLMLLALMVFGPRRLPEIGRQIGKLMYEFRKISNDFKFQMEEELRVSEEIERQRQLSAATAHTPPPAPDFTAQSLALQTPAQSASDVTALADASTPTEAANADFPVPPGDSAEISASSLPTIHPPTQGGVVPRAFRGLVPQPTAADEPALSEDSTPTAPTPVLTTSDATPSTEHHG